MAGGVVGLVGVVGVECVVYGSVVRVSTSW